MQGSGVQPTRFGDRFQVRAESGAGGMATVYRAVDVTTGEDVALKVLHEAAAGDRFNQEASLLAKMAHPAIVRYVDHGVTPGGQRYLAMEWLEGETLEQRLMRGPLGILDSLRLGRRLLEGLAVAHRQGIVHRDLKPGNVFLPQGELARAKILDFGIALRSSDTRRITATGASIGTPAYMSPEQVRGARTLDGRSDIFSLGSLLYECITGETPFAADTPLAVLAKICLEDSVQVAVRRPDLPVTLAAVLTRMLAKDPGARPAGAAEAAVEITRTIEDVTAEGHTTGVMAARRPTRPSSPVLAAVEQRVVCSILLSYPRASATTAFDDSSFARVQKVVAAFGGARVDRFLETALVVTLTGEGTPGDLAAQAARCALALRTALPAVCFGVGTGRAVVGLEALGELVAYTGRLLHGAPAGDVRLDEVTAGLLESRFQVRRVEVEGGPRQYHLRFEKGLKEPPRTVLGRQIPCIGRDREIGTLIALWDEAVGESVARAVVVTAAAGVGKSRVRHELINRLQAGGEPFELLIGRGDSVRASAPYAVLGGALRAAAGLVGGEAPAVAQQKLAAQVERHVPAANARRVAAFLGEIAGIPFPDDDLPQLRAARQDPRLMADQTLGAWLDFIEAECTARPVLLAIEDLHWADLPSVQLVDAALRTLRERPFMVLGFARPDVDDRFPALWTDRDVQRIALAPLTTRSAQKLLQQMVSDLPADKAAWVVARADGNPFYLEELARAVAGGDGPAESVHAMPDTVIGMVQSRFDSLGPDAKRVLRAAAVFGSTFHASGVRALIGDLDRGLHQWLDILAKKEMIFPREAGDTREYTFRHALLEEAAYAMLAGDDRVLGHRLAGEYLEQQGERAAIVLVDHFEKGGVLERAAHWCGLAAEQALDANDLQAVIDRVERGLRLGATGTGLGAMWVAGAQARFWRGEYREAEVAAAGAAALLTGTDRLLALRELIIALGQEAKFDDVEAWAGQVRNQRPPGAAMGAWLDCLVRAAGYLLPAGRYQAFAELIAEVSSHADLLEPSSRARLEGVQGLSSWHHQSHAEALARYEAAAREYHSIGDLRGETDMLASAAAALVEIGLLHDAEKRLTPVLDTAERLHLGHTCNYVLTSLCYIRCQLGRFADGRAAGLAALSRAKKSGDPRIEGAINTYLALAACGEGDYSGAEKHARTACELLASMPPVLPAALAALARALLSRGDRGEALEVAHRAYELLKQMGQVEDEEAAIRLVYAQCLAATGRDVQAKAIVQEAASRLRARAASFGDPMWRDAFLAVPTHATTIAMAADLAAAVDQR